MEHRSSSLEFKELLQKCNYLIQSIKHEDELRFANSADFRAVVHSCNAIQRTLSSIHESPVHSITLENVQDNLTETKKFIDKYACRNVFGEASHHLTETYLSELEHIQQKLNDSVQTLDFIAGMTADVPENPHHFVPSPRDSTYFCEPYKSSRESFKTAHESFPVPELHLHDESGSSVPNSTRSLHESARSVHDSSRSSHQAHETGLSIHDSARSMHQTHETGRSTHDSARSMHQTHETGRSTHDSARSIHPSHDTGRSSYDSARSIHPSHDTGRSSYDSARSMHQQEKKEFHEPQIVKDITSMLTRESNASTAAESKEEPLMTVVHSNRDSKEVASVSTVVNGVVAHSLKGHIDAVTCVVGLPDGSLVSGSKDGTVKCWDMIHTPFPLTNGCLHTFLVNPNHLSQQITHPVVTNTGSHSFDHRSHAEPLHQDVVGVTCVTVDLELDSSASGNNSTVVDHGASQSSSSTAAMAASFVAVGDKVVIAAGYADGVIRVWDAHQAFKKTNDSVRASTKINSHSDTSISRIASSHVHDSKDHHPPACIHTLSEHEDAVSCIAWLSDGMLVSGSLDGTLKLWNQMQRESPDPIDRDIDGAMFSYDNHGQAIRALAVVSVGYVVFGTDNGELSVFSPHFKAVMHRWEAHKDSITATVLFQDNSIVSSSWDGTMKLWDVGNGLDVHCQGVMEHVSCVSRGGCSSAEEDDGEVVMNHVESISELCCADSTYIVANYGLHSAKIWNPVDGSCKQTIWLSDECTADAHISTVTGVRDGKVAVGLSDGTILLLN